MSLFVSNTGSCVTGSSGNTSPNSSSFAALFSSNPESTVPFNSSEPFTGDSTVTGSKSSPFLFSSTPASTVHVSSTVTGTAGSTSSSSSSCFVLSAPSFSDVSSSSTDDSSSTTTTTATVPAGCSSELQEVTALLASRCDKFLSGRAPRQSQGKGQTERQGMVPQATSSSKSVDAAAHTPAATAEQKYEESMLCSVPMTGAPSTSTLSVPLDSKSSSLVLSSSQPAEEEKPYLPSVDLLDSTIEMWERVVANKKTDQEVTEEGLRHFYEGINYFCLQYKRLQETTTKYSGMAKASDDQEKVMALLEDKLAEACRKLDYFEKEKKRLEHELAGSTNTITALTSDKESLLRVQVILHKKIFELARELEEAGPAALQKYKASSLYKQELMEYAAGYMGKGVNLAIEKIKGKDPTFDPKTYGLEEYMLPPEAYDEEFSSVEEGDGGVDQEHNEVKPSSPARDLADLPVSSNNKEPTVLGLNAENAKPPQSSA